MKVDGESLSRGSDQTRKHVFNEEDDERRRYDDAFEDEVLATALLDRLLHHAEVIAINGNSYRMKDRQQATLLAKGGSQKEPDATQVGVLVPGGRWFFLKGERTHGQST